MKIYKQLILFFIPVLIGTFVQQLYSTVDTIIVGRFVGTLALASIGGSVAIITEIVISFFNGLSGGASVVICQAYGENNINKLRSSIQNAYLFSFVFGIILTIFGFILAPHLLILMNTPSNMLIDSLLYLRVYFLGIVFILFYNMGASTLRALGDSLRPFIYLIICSCLNIVLDLLFVCIFKQGIFGVAFATVIAQAISAVLITYTLNKRLSFIENPFLIVDRFILKRELSIGLPGALQACAYGISNIILQIVINSFGTNIIAGWAIYGKLDMIFWAVASALSTTVTTFVGQCYGANKKEQLYKVIRFNTFISYAFCGFILVILFVFCKPLYHLFTTDDKIISIATYMLRFLAPSYLISILLENLSGGLRGMGDVFYPTLFTFIGIFCIRLPWLFFTNTYHSLTYLLISYPLAWGFTLLLLIPYYLIKKKKYINTF